MKVSQFMARQYACPTGLFGRLVVARWLNHANRRANEAVLRQLEPKVDSSALEVGFGGGELLLAIAARVRHGSVVGLESSEDMVQRTQRRIESGPASARVNVQAGVVERMPFSDCTFDRVCTVNTLYFWPDLDAGIAELGRVTMSAGRLVLGFGTGTRLAERGYLERGFSFYPVDTVKECLRRHDFRPLSESVIDRPGRDDFHVVACIKA